MKLNPDLFTDKVKKEATRIGFGLGLVAAARADKNVVALTADLAASTALGDFIKEFPERFIQVGVAEQNLAAVASGLAHVGKIPFATSFSMFNPGRNWEQIRTTIGYNNQPVKIVGTHSGLGVGEDGATHQALEDIAITRVIPGMVVLSPCDAIQAKQATIAAAKTASPTYLRLNRQRVPTIFSEDTSFEIGKAQLVRDGKDVTIIAAGPMLYPALVAAEELGKEGISAAVINMHTIKPLDSRAIVTAARKTGRIVTVEDHQIHGGLGSAVAEVVVQECPVPMNILGMPDKYGESGHVEQLFVKFGLTEKEIAQMCRVLLR
ncbi:TPA: transketolase family protein [Candidatus Woesearchaeota archaeon]|nr:transketolase family protein [Candidatus Woesearchaeota archaeon]HII68410.1 transketolase family protein [Candidatus Woesearchaeota archaeon]